MKRSNCKPVKIPSDPATLRAEAVIQVEQDCDNPSEQPTTPTTPSQAYLTM